MNTVALALRNLLRNQRRSLTTLLALMLGAISILLFGGYVRNIIDGMETSFVSQGGHLQIQHRDFFSYGTGNPTAYAIADYQSIIDRLKSDPVLEPMLSVVTPTLQIGGIAGNFALGVSRSVLGNGLVVEDQNQMRRWNDYNFPITMQPLALLGTKDDAAVIGTGVARVLQLCAQLKVNNCEPPISAPVSQNENIPTDIAALSAPDNNPVNEVGSTRIELLAPNAHGAPNVAQLSVVKAEDQGIKELDDIFIALHLPEAQRLVYGNSAPRVTAIIVQLKHTRDIPAAKARIEQLLAKSFNNQPLAVLDFMTLNPFFGQTVKMFDTIFGFISVLIGAIMLFMLGNTMSMTVIERTVEIGTLRAIGLHRDGIRRLFLCEGLLLGSIGVTLGISVALILAYLITHSGLNWMPPGRTARMPIVVTIWGNTSLIVISAVGLILIAALSTWWPARLAAKMHIVDALRHT